MKRIKTLVYGILAGFCISLGGAIFLSLDNKIVGTLLFTVGLFTIVTQGFNLFTGKVCYVFEKDGSYALDLVFIWLGNLIGCLIFGSLLLCTRVGAGLSEKAAGIVATKLGDGLLSIFLLSVFCNILIFIAVDGFNNGKHELGKYLALFFGIMVFILCGFEHCVANMFYFTVAKAWSGKAILYLIVMTLGNSVGGVIFPLIRMACNRKKEEVAAQ
ncbi:MAG: formate/nitrite transporter family protein [Oscillospiraceae bacterium]|nr:formate/nitrite transporter family protein [Oscillospiraceae bacterium]